MKYHSTIIQMMTSITDPVIIERCYQIFAAKRDLLAHSYMEPVKLSKIEVMVEHPQDAGYKLAPSLYDVMLYQGAPGKFMLRLTGMPKVCTEGFHNGQLFRMRKAGFERSHVQLVSAATGITHAYRKAIIHNKHLESVFRFDCGCINKCICPSKPY